MIDILSEMNFKVTVAIDGYQALALVEDGAFGAIMMDVNMPGIDGIETLRLIEDTRPGAKVILMTGSLSLDVVLGACREGASTVLFKPLDISRIETLLRGDRLTSMNDRVQLAPTT